MALTIPNLESSPTFDGQSVPDNTDFTALQVTESGTGVVTGCGVTADTGLTVTVASGTVVVAGVLVAVTGTTVTANAASTYDRKDIVVVNSSGTISVTEGTPCTTAGWTRSTNALPPVKPAIPSNSVLLAELYIASTTTTITSGNIVDKTTPAVSTMYAPTGLTGATTLTRYVGGTAGGPPTSGTFLAGDYVIDNSGNIWVCTTGGTSGTWAAITAVGVGTPATATQQSATMTASSANIVSGSLFRLNTGEISLTTRFRFEVGIAKTGAGTATWKIDVKFGTAGDTSDATIATFTSGTNTAAADQATLVIIVNVLTLGSSATANCLAFYQNQLTTATGLGSLPGKPGSTATFNSGAAQPYLHLDVTPGASAVMNAWCSAERLA
jgi:hypothetical protein